MKQKGIKIKKRTTILNSLSLTAALTCSQCVLTLAEQRERMNFINKTLEGKLIVVSTLRSTIGPKQNYCIIDSFTIKTKHKTKSFSEKSNTFWKAWIGLGGKFPVPSQKALKTTNGTSACKRLVCSKITGGRVPHSQIRVGSHQWGDENRGKQVLPLE